MPQLGEREAGQVEITYILAYVHACMHMHTYTQVAWLPQLGEREVGKVEIPIPDAKDGTFRVRMEEPVRAELCWIAYPAPATKKVDDWEKVDAPAGKTPQLTGAW